MEEIGFGAVRVSAATGRHLALVGIKRGVSDMRPSDEDRAASDEHVNTNLQNMTKASKQ